MKIKAISYSQKKKNFLQETDWDLDYSGVEIIEVPAEEVKAKNKRRAIIYLPNMSYRKGQGNMKEKYPPVKNPCTKLCSCVATEARTKVLFSQQSQT